MKGRLIGSGLIAQADIGERRREQPAQNGEPDEILHREETFNSPCRRKLATGSARRSPRKGSRARRRA
jgi:hypothetical protein